MREDNVQPPPQFIEIANARAMGAPIRVLQGGSRLQAVRNKLLVMAVFQNRSVIGLLADPQPFCFRYDEVDRFTQHAVRKYVNSSYRGTDITCWFGLAPGGPIRQEGKEVGLGGHPGGDREWRRRESGRPWTRRAWASVSVPRVPNLNAFIALVRAATSS
jgi:hypothetical protein